jgi:chromatin remodeling complex protein RSC6
MSMSNAVQTKQDDTGTKAARKPNAALMKPLQPSIELAAVVGSAPLPRTEVVSKVWEYVKGHQLQNPQNKREILADAKLQAIFGGKSTVSMFEMNKHLAQHLS